MHFKEHKWLIFVVVKGYEVALISVPDKRQVSDIKPDSNHYLTDSDKNENLAKVLL